MAETRSTIRVVIARTDQPMRFNDGEDALITPAALRLVAVREGWKIEDIPGPGGHIQAVAEIRMELSIGNDISLGFHMGAN